MFLRREFCPWEKLWNGVGYQAAVGPNGELRTREGDHKLHFAVDMPLYLPMVRSVPSGPLGDSNSQRGTVREVVPFAEDFLSTFVSKSVAIKEEGSTGEKCVRT
jgi:hypothetical protein